MEPWITVLTGWFMEHLSAILILTGIVLGDASGWFVGLCGIGVFVVSHVFLIAGAIQWHRRKKYRKEKRRESTTRA